MLIELWCSNGAAGDESSLREIWHSSLQFHPPLSPLLSLPPLLLSVVLPANSSLVTLSTTRITNWYNKARTKKNTSLAMEKMIYSFLLHPAIIWRPKTVEICLFRECWPSTYALFHTLHSQYWPASSKGISATYAGEKKHYYTFTAPVWTSQVPRFQLLRSCTVCYASTCPVHKKR